MKIHQRMRDLMTVLALVVLFTAPVPGLRAQDEGGIKLEPAISSTEVYSGDKVVISALVKAQAGVREVSARVESGGAAVAYLKLEAPESEFPNGIEQFSTAIWMAKWEAGEIRDQTYNVIVSVTDHAGKVREDGSLFIQGKTGTRTTMLMEPPRGPTGVAPPLVVLGTAGDTDGTDGAYYAIIKDDANRHVYVGTDYSGASSDGPARVVKFNMGAGDNPPTRVGHITLQTGENDLRCGLIDTVNGFAYFGTNTFPGKIIKIRLSDFTRVGAITLETGENGVWSGYIDPAQGYAWFGLDTSPGKVVKVRLSDFTRIPGVLTLNAGENQLRCMLVDTTNGFGYFGCFTSPGAVARIRLGAGDALPTRVDSLVTADLDNIDFIRSAMLLPENGEAVFGTFQPPNAHRVKVNLGTGPITGQGKLGKLPPSPMTVVDFEMCPSGALKVIIRCPGGEFVLEFYEIGPGLVVLFNGMPVGLFQGPIDSETFNQIVDFYSGVVTDICTFFITSFSQSTVTKFKLQTVERTPSPTPSPTRSPTPPPTASPTRSPTAAATTSPSASPTRSPTAAATASPSASPTRTPTSPATASPTRSPTASPTATPTSTSTGTGTATPTRTATRTPTATKTPYPTRTPTRTPTASRTPYPTRTPTTTKTPYRTRTPYPTRTPTRTPYRTRTPYPTRTPTPTPLPPALDFGDAADANYQTLLVSNGPRHVIVPGFFLGLDVDADPDGVPSADASGDDVLDLNDDEDGVLFLDPLVPGEFATVQVTASARGQLDAWIDFNGDGDFFDPNERIAGGFPLNPGPNRLVFGIPGASPVTPGTASRFRLSFNGGLPPFGPAFNGEVEDHMVPIVAFQGEMDFGDARDPYFPTRLTRDGARHVIVNGVFLGQYVEEDPDGRPTLDADGDDFEDFSDDEDGVVFTSALAPGGNAGVQVTASTNGFLDAWIDFNDDDDWDDAGEQIFASQAVSTGVNNLNFAVPNGSAGGPVHARFRYSLQGGLDYRGIAASGEVEDHLPFIVGGN